MIDGLGLAETTPGPLILVRQFVGYLGGLKETGSLGRYRRRGDHAVDDLRALLSVDLRRAPYVEHLGQRPKLAGALSAITAAVVGVILNLSLWFALHVLFAQVGRLPFGVFRPWWPELASIDAAAAAISAVAALALFRFHLGIVKTLALCAALGLLWKIAVG